MISAMAVGGRVLSEPRFVEAAARAAGFALDRLRVDGRLQRSFRDGRDLRPGVPRGPGLPGRRGCSTSSRPPSSRAGWPPRSSWPSRARSSSPTGRPAAGSAPRPTTSGSWPARSPATTGPSRAAPRWRSSTRSGSTPSPRDDRWREVAVRALRAHASVAGAAAGRAPRDAARARLLHRRAAARWCWSGRRERRLRPTCSTSCAAPSSRTGSWPAPPRAPPPRRSAGWPPVARGKVAVGGRPTAYVCERGSLPAPGHRRGRARGAPRPGEAAVGPPGRLDAGGAPHRLAGHARPVADQGGDAQARRAVPPRRGRRRSRPGRCTPARVQASSRRAVASSRARWMAAGRMARTAVAPGPRRSPPAPPGSRWPRRGRASGRRRAGRR